MEINSSPLLPPPPSPMRWMMVLVGKTGRQNNTHRPYRALYIYEQKRRANMESGPGLPGGKRWDRVLCRIWVLSHLHLPTPAVLAFSAGDVRRRSPPPPSPSSSS